MAKLFGVPISCLGISFVPFDSPSNCFGKARRSLGMRIVSRSSGVAVSFARGKST